MIRAIDLTRYYGKRLGVENINFTIEKGEIVGLLGPNGAGKSTIMKMLAGYQLPASGTVEINGRDILDILDGGMTEVGFMPEIPPLYLEMEVEELLKFTASMKKIEKQKQKEHIEEVMKLVNIHQVRERIVGNLSKGYRQRVGMAQALIGFPEVIILDEPTVGMDPAQINEVRMMLSYLKKEHSIIISSHILAEITEVCDRVLIMNHGRLVAADTIENLKNRQSDDDRFYVKTDADMEKMKTLLKVFPEISEIHQLKEGQYLVMADDSDELRKTVNQYLTEQGTAVFEIKKSEHSLEEIFLKLTKEG